MATQKNLKYKKGETWVIYCDLNDGNNTPLNLTNATVEFVMKTNTSNSNVIYVSTSNGITITNASLGQCKILVSSNLQSNISLRTYEYEVFVTLPNGDESSQIEGELKVDRSLFT